MEGRREEGAEQITPRPRRHKKVHGIKMWNLNNIQRSGVYHHSSQMKVTFIILQAVCNLSTESISSARLSQNRRVGVM